MEGFIQRTPRGREATPKAFQHLGVPYKPIQRDLFS
ncbi:MAG: Holliday junction DNA helicase RuvB C-terminal domain-containing protein [Saprospiraceae bacterium]